MYKIVASLPRILQAQLQGREYRFLKLPSPSFLGYKSSHESLHIATKHKFGHSKMWIFPGWIKIALPVRGHCLSAYLNELFNCLSELPSLYSKYVAFGFLDNVRDFLLL